jgi:hypothetical protein
MRFALTVGLIAASLLMPRIAGAQALDAEYAGEAGTVAEQGASAPLDSPRAVGGLAEDVPERLDTGARLGAALGGGLLGTLGGGLVGGGTFWLLGGATCDNGGFGGRDFCMALMGAFGGALGGLIGLPLGVRWGGSRAGGNGSAWGAAGGVLVAVGSAGLLAHANSDLAGPVLLTAPLLAVLGYEMTDRDPGSITPTLAMAPGQGSLGLQGSF